jgi:hypothetical protein
MDPQGAPRYAAIYELESPEVLTSPAFAKAVDHGAGRRSAAVYQQPASYALPRDG